VRIHGVLITLVLTGVVPVSAQQPIPPATVSAIAAATRLMDQVAKKVWPGWESAPTQLLLVTDSTEFFLQRPRTGEVTWRRPRIFSPTFLATFPAVGGVPTIVIGTPERTGLPPDRWILTVQHEHFHQFEYTRPDYYTRLAALGLAHGDTTGMWALNFPFPYDSLSIQIGVRQWAVALHEALLAPDATRAAATARARAAKRALDAMLAPDDRKYLDFQLWQEGVPRWIELAMARAGARNGLVSDSTLAWQEDRIVTTLTKVDLGRQHREVVYALGAAVAELLERGGKDWKGRYFERMFELDGQAAERSGGP
jgi:hypothetical protein